MSDDTTSPPEQEPVQEPVQESKTTPTAVKDRRLSDKSWALIVAAALLVGCFLGAGTVAVGAFVAGHLFHDRDRAYVDHDRRDDHRRQPPPIRKQPAPPRLPKMPPPTAAPTPSS